MNSHLSREAMLRWHAGDASEMEQAHIAECAECQAQTQPLADALQWFGSAARQWGAEKAASTRTSRVDVRTTLRWGRFAAALALACMLLAATGIALLRWQKTPSVPTQAHVQQQQETSQQQLARDNALLEAVDQDVSQEVPSAMQPLSWNASDTTTRQ
jgi:hypothetical protein